MWGKFIGLLLLIAIIVIGKSMAKASEEASREASGIIDGYKFHPNRSCDGRNELGSGIVALTARKCAEECSKLGCKSFD